MQHAKRPRPTFAEQGVDAGPPIDRGSGDLAVDALLQMQRRGSVIGVHVGVERRRPRMPQRKQHLQIAVDGVDDRVDQQRLPGGLARQQAGVSARHRAKRCLKITVGFHSMA